MAQEAQQKRAWQTCRDKKCGRMFLSDDPNDQYCSGHPAKPQKSPAQESPPEPSPAPPVVAPPPPTQEQPLCNECGQPYQPESKSDKYCKPCRIPKVIGAPGITYWDLPMVQIRDSPGDKPERAHVVRQWEDVPSWCINRVTDLAETLTIVFARDATDEEWKRIVQAIVAAGIDDDIIDWDDDHSVTVASIYLNGKGMKDFLFLLHQVESSSLSPY